MPRVRGDSSVRPGGRTRAIVEGSNRSWFYTLPMRFADGQSPNEDGRGSRDPSLPCSERGNPRDTGRIASSRPRAPVRDGVSETRARSNGSIRKAGPFLHHLLRPFLSVPVDPSAGVPRSPGASTRFGREGLEPGIRSSIETEREAKARRADPTLEDRFRRRFDRIGKRGEGEVPLLSGGMPSLDPRDGSTREDRDGTSDPVGRSKA